jgi:hypothetical protein
MAAFGSGVSGIVFYALLGRFGTRFAAKGDLATQAARLDVLEARMINVATRQDFEKLDAAVDDVKLQTTALTERISGLMGSLTRIERGMSQLVDARLQWERDR